MPIFRTETKLVYYAHVPKCGGVAIENYLARRFGTLALLDKDYLAEPEKIQWTKSSPQHMDRFVFEQLFPVGFIDASFCIVRNPIDRIVSAWHFQLEVEKTIPTTMTFAEWLGSIDDVYKIDPFAFDNHVRPMDHIVPPNAFVFHLELGLNAIVPWLDDFTGNSDGPRVVSKANQRKSSAAQRSEKIRPNEEELALINKIYGVDFARFGYTMGQTGAPVSDPDASVSKPSKSPRPKKWLSTILRSGF